jgi:hypothetical protein
VDINNKDNYKIFTMDDNDNLLIGHLEVKDVENLTKLRDVLMKCNAHTFNLTEHRTGCANGIDIPRVEVFNDVIVTRSNFREEYIKTFYDERSYQSLYLNSILIFTSLLGELDESKYGNVSRQFIKRGIFKLLPLSQSWSKCSKELFKNKDSQDYKLFCEVLDSGDFFEYVIDDSLNLKNDVNHFVFSELKLLLDDKVYEVSSHCIGMHDFLREVSLNSEIFGTSRKKRRRK